MNSELATEAVQFEQVVTAALTSAGGFDLVHRAELEPDYRLAVGELLGSIGTWDVDPRGSAVELEVAAVVCRAAGRFALPYPVAERLSADRSKGVGAVAFVGKRAACIQHGDLDLRWSATDVDGRSAIVTQTGSAVGGRLGRFATQVQLGPWQDSDAGLALVLTLQAWTLLGMADQALAMTCHYALERRQFDQPLAAFQSVQFALTDVAVAVQGLEELAKYTLWSVAKGGRDSIPDALALRLAALETADIGFRVAHQTHGAIGFCDETPISWLSRYSQPLRRLPWGRTHTEEALLRALTHAPFAGAFQIPRSAA